MSGLLKTGEGPHHGPTRVMASAPSVVQQARLMDDAGSAWHAVKCGNLEMITKLFPTQCSVYAKGPVGENVMHVAMLLNTPSTLAITRYLVKLYGTVLVNCPVQERRQVHDPPGTYEGQTALHIAIVNRDFDMVKFLVQNGADIRACAWGTFFKPGGPMYYGEYPLSFAACTGQKDVVAYLKRHGARVNTDCDAHGNTALHMCVYHSQPDMYDFLVDYCAASDTVRNYGGLTPLVLAAHLGKQDMLQHIYSRRRRAFYSFGKVTSYSLALREIDTVQDEDTGLPDGGYVPNALEVVLRKRHLGLLSEPLLTTLLAHKWEAFARTQFLLHFLGYLLLEVSQTILIWLHSEPHDWNSPARASQEFIGVFLALVMLAVEVLDYSNWSREAYHRRLTMTVHNDEEPPLYPIPGEATNFRDGRVSLFARLSARMGFAGHSAASQGTHSSFASVARGRSSDSMQTPFAASQAPAAASTLSPIASAALTVPLQSEGSGTARRGSGVPGRLNMVSQGIRGIVSPLGSSGGASGSPRSPNQRSSLRPKQQQQPSAGSRGDLVAAGSQYSTTQGVAKSPSRNDQQMLLKVSRLSHDDPLNLQPGLGGQVIGQGGPSTGVAVVDSGYTAAAGGGGQPGSDGGRLPNIGPGPLAEAKEDHHQQQQQQKRGTGGSADGSAAAVPLLPPRQTLSSSGHGGNVYNAISNDDEDELDVVSVGLRSSRVRSHAALAELAAITGGGNTQPQPAAAAAVPTASSAGDAAAAQQGGRSIMFSENLSRAASGRVSGGTAAAAAAGAQGAVAPLLSPQLSTEGSLNTINPAAAGTDGSGAAAASTGSGVGAYSRQRGSTLPPYISGRTSRDGATSSADASAHSSGSASAHHGIPRARSFHGITPGPAGVGTGGEGSVAIARSGRSSTAHSELDSPSLVATSTPADPLEAVQMLERQRHRARSGGGDLPAAISLKRTPASKKEPSMLGQAGNGPAAAAAAGGGSAADGHGDNRSGSFGSLAAVSGGGDGGDGHAAKSDVEKGQSTFEPHKTHMRALLETTYEGCMRMLDDPWLFIWHLHLLLTCMHFLIWISSYGWVGGSGPSSLHVRQLDDVIVSMMGLSGWLAVIYFFRGFAATGKLAVILERCIVDVVKFVSLYILWNLGFSLAFFTMQNGVLAVAPSSVVRNTDGLVQLSENEPDPFSTLGFTMVTLINLGTGLSHYEYAMTCKNGYVLSSVLCTMYYLLYLATVVLLLLNLLTAMIISTWNTTQSAAEASWKHRWAVYVIKAERRLPNLWVQRLRLGQQAWDPVTRKPVYSHVFETVDDDKAPDASKTTVDGQIKGLESLLEELKKRRTSQGS